jgi:hypothetical protein
MTVRKTGLPGSSFLKKDGNNYDYIYSCQSDFTTINDKVSPAETGKAFFTCGPKWVKKFSTIRNIIVGPLGLKHRET